MSCFYCHISCNKCTKWITGRTPCNTRCNHPISKCCRKCTNHTGNCCRYGYKRTFLELACYSDTDSRSHKGFGYISRVFHIQTCRSAHKTCNLSNYCTNNKCGKKSKCHSTEAINKYFIEIAFNPFCFFFFFCHLLSFSLTCVFDIV